MKKYLNAKTILLIAVLAVGAVLLVNAGRDTGNTSDPSGSSSDGTGATKVTVYKSATCGCCGNYVSYLKKEGFDVEVVTTENTAAVKEQFHIPREGESCHTSVFGDYAVEGHMPIEAVRKLLAEKPDISGIALPGMPSGSPGMPGSKQGPFVIHGFDDEGGMSEFMSL